MRSLIVVCLIGLSVVCALPARKDEVETVPEVNPFGDQPIVDTGIVFPSFNFGDLMTRLREQMDSVFNSFPFPSKGNASNDEDFIHGIPFAIPQFPPIDLDKANTTSVTKIINGHKVVINETEYNKEDGFGGSFFKIRIVDIKPENETDTPIIETPKPTEVTKDREPLENSFENEIPKGEDYSNLETFDETDNSESFAPQSPYNPKPTDLSRDIMVNDLVDNNYVNPDAETIPQETFASDLSKDLSRDTYINDIASNLGRPINPDAEFIGTSNNRPVSQYDNVETFDEVNKRPSEWRDLSRDTYVNELAANNPYYINPDAEFIPPSQVYAPQNINNAPKFERLESFGETPPRNLNQDIYINQIAANAGHPINPYSEFVSLDGESLPASNYEYKHVR